MRNIVKSAFVRACITFTVAMALWCTAGLIFAGPDEGNDLTLTQLAAALALCALQAVGFTEAGIGRLSYPARIAGFGLTGLPALVLCAALGGWFPLDNIGAWVSFVAIYLVTLAAITAVFTFFFRRSAGSCDAAFARYRVCRNEYAIATRSDYVGPRPRFPRPEGRVRRFSRKSALISVWKAPTVNYYIVLR